MAQCLHSRLTDSSLDKSCSRILAFGPIPSCRERRFSGLKNIGVYYGWPSPQSATFWTNDRDSCYSFNFSHQVNGLTKRSISPGVGDAFALPHVFAVTTPD